MQLGPIRDHAILFSCTKQRLCWFTISLVTVIIADLSILLSVLNRNRGNPPPPLLIIDEAQGEQGRLLDVFRRLNQILCRYFCFSGALCVLGVCRYGRKTSISELLGARREEEQLGAGCIQEMFFFDFEKKKGRGDVSGLPLLSHK